MKMNLDTDWEYESEAINQNSTVSRATTSSSAHLSALAAPTESMEL